MLEIQLQPDGLISGWSWFSSRYIPPNPAIVLSTKEYCSYLKPNTDKFVVQRSINETANTNLFSLNSYRRCLAFLLMFSLATCFALLQARF
jgi:hypothetical protein